MTQIDDVSRGLTSCRDDIAGGGLQRFPSGEEQGGIDVALNRHLHPGDHKSGAGLIKASPVVDTKYWVP